LLKKYKDIESVNKIIRFLACELYYEYSDEKEEIK
jgi:hypothetical protein